MVRIVRSKQRPLPPDFNPRQFHDRRNTVLVVRPNGGAGDIIMHRLMFEDMRSMHPDLRLHFACPAKFHDLVVDHPFVDRVLESDGIQTRDYVVSYNTASACLRYEMAHYPAPMKHRSDIWAEHCGATLVRHDAHMRVSEETRQLGRNLLSGHRRADKPVLLLCPYSAMNIRNLIPQHIRWLAEMGQQAGCEVLGCHTKEIEPLREMGIPTLQQMSTKEWIGVMAEADYVVSTDTSHFHLAGVLKKPLLGVFAMTDGKVYGKYYDCVTVQKHRDDGDWPCGPCYDWTRCPKSSGAPFPCMSLIPKDLLSRGMRQMFERWPRTA